jgi:nitrite reductase/ring-hydroxylating ferredoxin subunit
MTKLSRFPFHPYPNGWFVVAFSHELPVLGVQAIHYFGQELVLFRTADGTARVLDAYCPHLGAHLGCGGKVDGDSVRCPFHGWKFDGSGQCVEVPFASKIPPRAAVRGWLVREIDGAIYVYHHAEGLPPSWEIPSIHTDEWSGAAHFSWKLRTTNQEVFENTVDTAHLPPVHDSRRPGGYTPKLTSGPVLSHDLHIQWDGNYIGFPGLELDVRLAVSVHGLSMIHVDTFADLVGMQARQRFFATPIDEEYIQLRAAVHVKKLPDEQMMRTVETMFRTAFETDFVKDFPIWENKAYRAQPMLSDADGPIGTYRKWVRQFYSDLPSAEAHPVADGRAARVAGHVALPTVAS